jgi:hypothetical protein
MNDRNNRLKVFVSYSQSDCEWAERLLAHLSIAESKGLVEYWSDQKIQAGSEWKQEIEKAIKQSKVFVILVSPDYVASPFSADFELPLIKEASEDEALILPVIIKPTVKAALGGLSKYQTVNDEALSSLSPKEQEKLLIKLANKINAAILEHKKKIESNSGQILASAIGGAIIGNLIIPGIGGALLGGLLGGALGGANKGGKDDD